VAISSALFAAGHGPTQGLFTAVAIDARSTANPTLEPLATMLLSVNDLNVDASLRDNIAAPNGAGHRLDRMVLERLASMERVAALAASRQSVWP
jgi:hypothetical protein